MNNIYSKTPEVSILDNRGLTVRDIAYYRHPDSPDVTRERITRHQYNARGFLTQSTDPRMHDAGLANFTYLTDLAGNVLRSQGVDNGMTVALNDIAGRPFIAVSNISTTADGTRDRDQAVTHTWQYEDVALPGRPLSITEQIADDTARITERFVYGGNTDAEKVLNLAGACVCHYDTAGLTQTDSISMTGVPLSVTRRLLNDADNPDTVADWQGADTPALSELLAGEAYTTLNTADATGAVLTTTDAKGNRQRVAYNVAGQLSGSWLTLKGGKEQPIVASLTYSAAGQKLREEHGNGVVTAYTYEAETQRLIGIKMERPAGHASGTKVLQDLRYEYDPVGNVLGVSNDAEETRFWRNQKVAPENRYTYDSLYRLVSATGREMANAGRQSHALPDAALFDSATYTNYTRIYSYDSGGNLTQIRHSPATGRGYTTRITVSDCSNRGVLSTLTENPSDVDALFTPGGQQMQLLPGQVLSWTSRGELLKVAPVVREGDADDRESYRYDAGSQRILKVSIQKTGNSTQTQHALYLPGLEHRSTIRGNTEMESLQVVTMSEGGRAQVRVLHWESGRPDGISNDQIRYGYDNLSGSSTLELDGYGNLISREEYYPYGGTAIWTARNVADSCKTVRYAGKERDATGLYYYGYRYYQPWAGRWLSADPAGTVDGLNLFRMVRNNPVSNFDSSGLITVDDLVNDGLPREGILHAFQDTNAWAQLIALLKNQYSSLPDDEFDELSQNAQALFSSAQADAEISLSKGNDIFDTDNDITDDLRALFDINNTDKLAVSKYPHRVIKRELKNMGDNIIFRGDTRSPDIILKEGFTPRGNNEDLVKYVHSNAESVFVSFTTDEKIARRYAVQKETEGYMYIVKRQKEHIDVNEVLSHPGVWQDKSGKSLGRRFYEYAKEIAVPHGVEGRKIVGWYRVGRNKRYEGDGKSRSTIH